MLLLHYECVVFLLWLCVRSVVTQEFPPVVKNEKTYEIAPNTFVSTQYYEIMLNISGGTPIWYQYSKDGNRLTTNKATPLVLQMFSFNKNGYVFVNPTNQDFLCLNQHDVIKMLTLPHEVDNVLNDCILYFDVVSSSRPENLLTKYKITNNKVCVTQSNIPKTFDFKLYFKKNEKKQYIKIDRLGLWSAPRRIASHFEIAYSPCFEYYNIKPIFLCKLTTSCDFVNYLSNDIVSNLFILNNLSLIATVLLVLLLLALAAAFQLPQHRHHFLFTITNNITSNNNTTPIINTISTLTPNKNKLTNNLLTILTPNKNKLTNNFKFLFYHNNANTRQCCDRLLISWPLTLLVIITSGY
uniref:Ac81 n=1 Tax=Cnaphalocrocis medinalis granulovirus TaxID=1750712 RepID=A0A109X257_9BBAC|nr:ac81 [Cnaphalocrocis medinalis granulovirus]